MGDSRGAATIPALLVLVADAAIGLAFGLTYSALLVVMATTGSRAERAAALEFGTRTTVLLLGITLTIALLGFTAAVAAVRVRRGAGLVPATFILGGVTACTTVAALFAHGGFDASRSPRWLAVAAVHGGALVLLRWRGERAAPDR